MSMRLDFRQPLLAPKLAGKVAQQSPLTGSTIGRKTETRQVSWWTKRATTGDVAPGFSRANLTREAAEDPKDKDGLFDRILSVLTELADVA
jgi:hypothetical protein